MLLYTMPFVFIVWQYSHALLILTKSSKSKNQVVHEWKFKDPLNNTYHVSSERGVLDLESVVQGFNTHLG